MGLEDIPERVYLQGPPKRRPQPVGQPCAQAICPYCRRYGALGQCEGCGAPNVPNTPTISIGGVLTLPRESNWIEVTSISDKVRRFIKGMP